MKKMKEKLKTFEDLDFFDEYIFFKVMKNNSFSKEILERLLNIQIEKIIHTKLNTFNLPNFNGQAARFDIYVKDSKRVLDIIIHNFKSKEIGKKLRLYQSIMDFDNLWISSASMDAKETCIIFICTKAPFAELDLPHYTITTSCITDKSIELEDRSTKVIFNINSYESEKDQRIHDFMKYLKEKIPCDSLTEKIEKFILTVKSDVSNKMEYVKMYS